MLQLLPLLIQSLHIEETGLQLSTLSTILDLVGDSPNIIVSHIDDIIPRLILLTHFKPSMVRKCFVVVHYFKVGTINFSNNCIEMTVSILICLLV